MVEDLNAEMGVVENSLCWRVCCVRDVKACADDLDGKVENVRGSDDDEETVDNRPTTFGPILIN